MKTTVLLASVLAAASPFAMADASDDVKDASVNVKSEVVHYDDVRLISAVGAAVLYGRLHAAAERACGGAPDSPHLSAKQRYRACVNDALKKAVAEVNNPVLTQYYESKRGANVPRGSSVPGTTAVADAR